MRRVLISTKPFIFVLLPVGVTVRSAESLSSAIPLGIQLREQILKEQITDGRVFFKMPFRPCPSGCDRSLFITKIIRIYVKTEIQGVTIGWRH